MILIYLPNYSMRVIVFFFFGGGGGDWAMFTGTEISPLHHHRFKKSN